MGNQQKFGSRRNPFKKRKCVGVQNRHLAAENDSQTPVQPRPTLSGPSSASSSRKAKVQGNFGFYSDKSEVLDYNVIDLNLLFKELEEIAVCRNCHHSLGFRKTSLEGLATQLNIFCPNCSGINKTFNNCTKIEQVVSEKPEVFYDIDLRLVNGLRSIGKGYTASQIICGVLNLPPPPSKYSKYESVLHSATEVLCKSSMEKAVEEAVAKNDGVRDLCVAVDGSWQKRGHTSLNGVLTLTSVDTGKVLDISVMSKYCECPSRGRNIHIESCKANYLGSSGGMEVAGALELFRRSVALYNVRYFFT